MSTDISMMYADVDLRPLIAVLKVVRPIGNERSLKSNVNRRIGISVNRVFIEPKIIEVTFSIASRTMTTEFIDTVEHSVESVSSLNAIKRQLANVFNVDEPKKLVFSDDSDIFYNAIQTGEIETTDINDWYAVCKMTFTVVDGLAHRKEPIRSQSVGNRLVVANSGGEVAVPKIEFTSASNLKMIAFTLGDKVFKIGKSTGSDVILSGQRVEIDMADGTILIDGNKRVYRSFDSRLIHLPVGRSTIGIAVNSGATIPIVKINFHEVFL